MRWLLSVQTCRRKLKSTISTPTPLGFLTLGARESRNSCRRSLWCASQPKAARLYSTTSWSTSGALAIMPRPRVTSPLTISCAHRALKSGDSPRRFAGWLQELLDIDERVVRLSVVNLRPPVQRERRQESRRARQAQRSPRTTSASLAQRQNRRTWPRHSTVLEAAL